MEKTPPLPSISCSGSGFSGFAAALASAGLAEDWSAATGGLVEEGEEEGDVWDGLPAGSAAVAVQANAEAKASEVIRIRVFRGIPFFGVN